MTTSKMIYKWQNYNVKNFNIQIFNITNYDINNNYSHKKDNIENCNIKTQNRMRTTIGIYYHLMMYFWCYNFLMLPIYFYIIIFMSKVFILSVLCYYFLCSNFKFLIFDIIFFFPKAWHTFRKIKFSFENSSTTSTVRTAYYNLWWGGWY